MIIAICPGPVEVWPRIALFPVDRGGNLRNEI